MSGCQDWAFYFPALWEDAFGEDRERLVELREQLLADSGRSPLAKDNFAAEIHAKARSAGLARPRSAALATSLGVIALSTLAPVLQDSKVLLCVCSNTATSSIAFKYETTGRRDGWALVDPFWLQHSIPSAPATSIFAALRLEGAALGFPGGAAGVDSALATAIQLLKTGTLDRAALVLTEHVPEFETELGLPDDIAVAGAIAFLIDETVSDWLDDILVNLVPADRPRDARSLCTGGFRHVLEFVREDGVTDATAAS